MSNHENYTPGPWYVSDHEDYTQVWKDYGDERVLIAEANDNWLEARQNALLIAAAPELLSALEEALPVLADAARRSVMSEMINGVPSNDGSKKVYSKIGAAIAKARGKSVAGQ
jgi:hypothetical protein